jgi:Family of unknown function (DUF6644)
MMLFLQAPTNPVSLALNSFTWVFPASEIFHIVGFGVSIGTIAAVDFSLLGVGIKRQLTPQLLKDTAPWTLTALVIVLMAGFVLFLTDPVHYLRNSSFQFKMTALVLAIIFNYTIHRKIAASGKASPGVSALVALVSLALWLCVVAGGLFIAFVAQG